MLCVPRDDTNVPTDDTIVSRDDTIVSWDDTIVSWDDTIVSTAERRHKSARMRLIMLGKHIQVNVVAQLRVHVYLTNEVLPRAEKH